MVLIEHIALWTDDIERLANFYAEYFGAIVGSKYANSSKGFESRFLTFESGARLELMKTSTLRPAAYEISACLVGSEMCLRDRAESVATI